jgi:DNA-binding MltR family transcriptional regulator
MSAKQPTVEELSAESNALYQAINEGSDLACVLIAMSFIDRCLASILKNVFIASSISTKILKDGPYLAGSVANRADLNYVLGRITKIMYQNIIKIIEIRNLFAHSHLEKSFEDPEIATLCNELSFPITANALSVSDGKKANKEISLFSEFHHPRTRFSIICVLAVNRLLLSGMSTDAKLQAK